MNKRKKRFIEGQRERAAVAYYEEQKYMDKTQRLKKSLAKNNMVTQI